MVGGQNYGTWITACNTYILYWNAGSPNCSIFSSLLDYLPRKQWRIPQVLRPLPLIQKIRMDFLVPGFFFFLAWLRHGCCGHLGLTSG